MKKIFLIILIAISLQGDMLSKGSTSIGIMLGGATINDEDYTIAGVNAKYFVIDDLSIGLGYEKWFSGDPDIDKITLESTYFLDTGDVIRPYAGVLYRRIFLDGKNGNGKSFSDTNSYGYRIGLAFIQDNLLISIGMVQETYDQQQDFFESTDTYGELTIGFSF